MDIGALIVGFIVTGIQAHGFLCGGQRFDELPAFAQQVGEDEAGPRVFRFKLQRLLPVRHGFGRLPLTDIRPPTLIVSLCEIRIERNRFGEFTDRAVIIGVIQLHKAALEMTLRHIQNRRRCFECLRLTLPWQARRLFDIDVITDQVQRRDEIALCQAANRLVQIIDVHPQPLIIRQQRQLARQIMPQPVELEAVKYQRDDIALGADRVFDLLAQQVLIAHGFFQRTRCQQQDEVHPIGDLFQHHAVQVGIPLRFCVGVQAAALCGQRGIVIRHTDQDIETGAAQAELHRQRRIQVGIAIADKDGFISERRWRMHKWMPVQVKRCLLYGMYRCVFNLW